jgi:hypothetical protein
VSIQSRGSYGPNPPLLAQNQKQTPAALALVPPGLGHGPNGPVRGPVLSRAFPIWADIRSWGSSRRMKGNARESSSRRIHGLADFGIQLPNTFKRRRKPPLLPEPLALTC